MVWLVSALFAFWIGATIVRQVWKGHHPVLNGMDRFSLIPRWTFFAPNPATSDYRLMFRDRYAGGRFSLYREVPLGARLSVLHVIWNPGKRGQKLLADSVRGLVRSAAAMHESGLKTTLGYLAILNYVASLPRTSASEATQFVIVETFGHFPVKEPRLVMQSEVHRLG
ncbi:MAG TPA: hypothetical protein VMH81_38330 [Bryobacteraceae bacterium]|nr:hypothetical protein [Bryobacteraceae bacterium]